MGTEAQDDTPVARPVVGMYFFFSPDPARLARFWADLMQLPVAEGATDDLVLLDFNHEVGRQTWIFERQDARWRIEHPQRGSIGLSCGLTRLTGTKCPRHKPTLHRECVRFISQLNGLAWHQVATT